MDEIQKKKATGTYWGKEIWMIRKRKTNQHRLTLSHEWFEFLCFGFVWKQTFVFASVFDWQTLKHPSAPSHKRKPWNGAGGVLSCVSNEKKMERGADKNLRDFCPTDCPRPLFTTLDLVGFIRTVSPTWSCKPGSHWDQDCCWVQKVFAAVFQFPCKSWKSLSCSEDVPKLYMFLWGRISNFNVTNRKKIHPKSKNYTDNKNNS